MVYNSNIYIYTGGAGDLGAPREEVLYNLGLQHLILGRPQLAFACLLEASKVLYARYVCMCACVYISIYTLYNI
jgi:hypothetical protein